MALPISLSALKDFINQLSENLIIFFSVSPSSVCSKLISFHYMAEKEIKDVK